MDLFEFRSKKTGETTAGDAALQAEQGEGQGISTPEDDVQSVQEPEMTPEMTDQTEDQDVDTSPDAQIEPETGDSDGEDTELPELSEREKTAFMKRLERERRKLEERLKQELEQQYGKHKQIIEMLGGDPDEIEKRIRENQIAQQAQRLAEQNGWDEEQMRWYIEQEKQKRELFDLRVQVQINKLKERPEYIGIESMENEIKKKIEQTGGVLTVEEAFWALGGPKRAEQIKIETQMREQAKRARQPRTVLRDAQTPTVTEKPLPPEIAREAERMGISLEEARRLMTSEPPGNLAEYRKRKAKAR